MDQISSDLLRKAFSTRHGLLFSSTMFCNIFALARTEIKSLRFWIRKWLTLFFFFFSFFAPFLFLLFLSFTGSRDWPSTRLASSSKNSEKEHHQEGQILPWSSHIQLKAILLWVFPQILSIFMDISGSTELITLTWMSLERSFPAAELEYRWCQF